MNIVAEKSRLSNYLKNRKIISSNFRVKALFQEVRLYTVVNKLVTVI